MSSSSSEAFKLQKLQSLLSFLTLYHFLVTTANLFDGSLSFDMSFCVSKFFKFENLFFINLLEFCKETPIIFNTYEVVKLILYVTISCSFLKKNVLAGSFLSRFFTNTLPNPINSNFVFIYLTHPPIHLLSDSHLEKPYIFALPHKMIFMC